ADGPENVRSLQRALRNTMTEHAGVVRDERGLRAGLAELAGIEKRMEDIGVHPDIAGFQDLAHAFDLRPAALAARATLEAALERRETRGSHNRSDPPATDPGFQINQARAPAPAAARGDPGPVPDSPRSPRSWRTCRPAGSWRSRPPGPGRRKRPGATPPGGDTVPRTVSPPEDQPERIPIMKVVVIGGTGLIGSKLVTKLGEQGHEAVPAAPETGVDTLTGEGLTKVLKDASVVVDVSNSPSFADDDVMHFFR